MSLRYEQYRALRRTQDFLRAILCGGVTWKRADLKAEASRCLKHFPPLKEDGEPLFSRDPFSEKASHGTHCGEHRWEEKDGKAVCRITGEIRPIKYADECTECPDCGEPFCEECQKHYADCDCVGPFELEA